MSTSISTCESSNCCSRNRFLRRVTPHSGQGAVGRTNTTLTHDSQLGGKGYITLLVTPHSGQGAVDRTNTTFTHDSQLGGQGISLHYIILVTPHSGDRGKWVVQTPHSHMTHSWGARDITTLHNISDATLGGQGEVGRTNTTFTHDSQLGGKGYHYIT